MQKILDLLKILSDEIRLKIICLLAQNELCVCELMEALKMSQSRISNHLRVLRDTGIIHSKREGKWIFYYLAPDKMDKVVWDIICLLYTSPSPRDRQKSRMPSSA